MTLSILLDLAVAALLVTTIVYAVVLNRRLQALRRAKDEMQAVIGDFTSAAKAAEASMNAMREAGDSSQRALKPLLDQAGTLRQELEFLVDRGTVVADGLSDGVRASRRPSSRSADPAGAPAEDAAERLRRILAATR